MRPFTSLSALAAVFSLVSPSNALVANSSINSQTRLAYAGSTGMTVSWNTFSFVSQPTVYYGLTPAMGQIATSNVSVTYDTSLTYNNHVKITGLTPDTVYYYLPVPMISSPTNGEGAGPFTFKTSRVAGDSTPYSIAVVVDMGTMGPEGLTTTAGKGVSPNNILKPGEINTIQSLSAAVDQFEFLWHPGDIAYADAWLKEEIQGFEPNTTIANGYTVYESILNGFYDEMTPITTVKPYMVGPGNHEANCDNGGTGGYTASICMPGQTNFTGYRNHFRMPSAESGGVENFWYSFDFGMTHYVQFDTETDLGHGLVDPDGPAGGTEDAGPFALMNAQANWLAADLAAVDRSKTPWVVVAGHRPWYSSGSVCSACQSAFEAVFIKYEVDLVLSGHFHVYERNAPIKNGTADPNELNNPSSPWYITNGAAGHYDGLDSFTLPLESFQRYGLSTNDSIYGWSKLTFHNCTHLTHDFINSANSSVLDTATLYKNRTCGASGTSSSSSSASLPTSKSSSSVALPTTTASVSLTTSVVYTTTLITVTSCAATVTNCPAESTKVVTSTIALYTTVCPGTATATLTSANAGSSSVATPASSNKATSSAGIAASSPATPASSNKASSTGVTAGTAVSSPVTLGSSSKGASSAGTAAGTPAVANSNSTKTSSGVAASTGVTKTISAGALQVTGAASVEVVNKGILALIGAGAFALIM